jgi:hypothetical protein
MSKEPATAFPQNIERRLRILEIYAAAMTLVLAGLFLAGIAAPKQKFDEIDVERINVVDKSGQLRLVIANSERMPDPIVNGKPFKTERPPGIIFYNGLGDEDGGLVFGAAAAKDAFGAYGGLSFDQYKQSQIVALTYNDHSGSRQAGLSVWDRPETAITDLIDKREAIDKMTDGPEKVSANKRFGEESFSPTSVFVGKDKNKDAKVTLYDAKGHARINMVVDATGQARLDFLDETGRVTSSLPNLKAAH